VSRLPSAVLAGLLVACASEPIDPAPPLIEQVPAAWIHGPPPCIRETPPPDPRVPVYWREGYWEWKDGAWTWRRGAWSRQVLLLRPRARRETIPPRPDGTSVWITGYWGWNGMMWHWVPGHWDDPGD